MQRGQRCCPRYFSPHRQYCSHFTEQTLHDQHSPLPCCIVYHVPHGRGVKAAAAARLSAVVNTQSHRMLRLSVDRTEAIADFVCHLNIPPTNITCLLRCRASLVANKSCARLGSTCASIG